jgi:cyclohexa-1,5-dienecarbonyl-CoA hydratase
MANLVIERTNGVARIALNAPPHNILTIPLMQELGDTLAALQCDTSAKVVVLAANGKSFCAGVDVADHSAGKVAEMIRVFHRIFHVLWAMPQPTVAAVQGAALGGGMELALGCDIIVASQRAKFGQPEIKVGVFPPIAALLLPAIVGRGKALQLILSGEPVSAEEAKAIGLVQEVASDADFDARLNGLTGQLAAQSGVVLGLAKRAAVMGRNASRARRLNNIERLYLDELMQTADAREGLAAFTEKRAPVWTER